MLYIMKTLSIQIQIRKLSNIHLCEWIFPFHVKWETVSTGLPPTHQPSLKSSALRWTKASCTYSSADQHGRAISIAYWWKTGWTSGSPHLLGAGLLGVLLPLASIWLCVHLRGFGMTPSNSVEYEANFKLRRATPPLSTPLTCQPGQESLSLNNPKKYVWIKRKAGILHLQQAHNSPEALQTAGLTTGVLLPA